MYCGLILLTLLLCGLCFPPCTDGQTREYFFVNENVNWGVAQEYCRVHYHNLATVSSIEDIGRLPRPPDYSGLIWIGLLNNATNMSWWSWSGSNLNDGYGKWANAGYKHPYSLQCVMMNNNGWYNKPCYKLFKALCFSGSNPKVFNISTTSQSWEEAQSYCRTNYIDLAMIKSKEENLQALQVIGSNEVWIGLSRTSWKWSDGTSASFTNWNSTIEDEYPEFAFCAAEMNDRSWDVLTCLSMEYPFYCQKKVIDSNENKKSSNVKIQLSSNLDQSDPTIYNLVLEQISKQFKEAGHADVKLKWMTPPKKQEQKEKNV